MVMMMMVMIDGEGDDDLYSSKFKIVKANQAK